MLIIYAGLLGAHRLAASATPTGFIPEQDQGFLIGVVQLPPGSSLERTERCSTAPQAIAARHRGVVDYRQPSPAWTAPASRQASNAGVMFLKLLGLRRTPRRGLSRATALAGQLTGAHRAGIEEGAQIFFIVAAGGAGPRQRQRLHDDDPGPDRRRLSARSRARPAA